MDFCLLVDANMYKKKESQTIIIVIITIYKTNSVNKLKIKTLLNVSNILKKVKNDIICVRLKPKIFTRNECF